MRHFRQQCHPFAVWNYTLLKGTSTSVSLQFYYSLIPATVSLYHSVALDIHRPAFPFALFHSHLSDRLMPGALFALVDGITAKTRCPARAGDATRQTCRPDDQQVEVDEHASGL